MAISEKAEEKLRSAAKAFVLAVALGIGSTGVDDVIGKAILEVWTVLLCIEVTLSLMLAEASEEMMRTRLELARLWP